MQISTAEFTAIYNNRRHLTVLAVLLFLFYPYGIESTLTRRRIRSDNGCMGLLVNPCQCNPPNTSTSIECVNAKFTDLDMEYFQTVGSGHFHTLRSVTFHGNGFTHLPPYMFGFYVENIAGLETLNLSKNAFVNISSEAFCGMQNLATLDLSDNHLELAEDDESLSLFRAVGKSLKFLKMHNSFQQPVDSGVQTGRLKKALEMAQFKRLHFLDLSSNNFEFLPFSFLCPLKELRNLDFSDNRLTTLNLDPQCFTNLHTLDLSRNYFTTLDHNFQTSVVGLKSDYSLRLANNLFECNCRSAEYLKWIERNAVKISDYENLICLKASPKKLAGQPIAAEVVFSLDQLDCEDPVTAKASSFFTTINCSTFNCCWFLLFCWLYSFCYILLKS